jgi:hypothetical protein
LPGQDRRACKLSRPRSLALLPGTTGSPEWPTVPGNFPCDPHFAPRTHHEIDQQ